MAVGGLGGMSHKKEPQNAVCRPPPIADSQLTISSLLLVLAHLEAHIAKSSDRTVAPKILKIEPFLG